MRRRQKVLENHGDYTCEECGETFEKPCSDEEALAWDMEHGLAMDKPGTELAVVCDDCFREIYERVRGVPCPEPPS